MLTSNACAWAVQQQSLSCPPTLHNSQQPEQRRCMPMLLVLRLQCPPTYQKPSCATLPWQLHGQCWIISCHYHHPLYLTKCRLQQPTTAAAAPHTAQLLPPHPLPQAPLSHPAPSPAPPHPSGVIFASTQALWAWPPQPAAAAAVDCVL